MRTPIRRFSVGLIALLILCLRSQQNVQAGPARQDLPPTPSGTPAVTLPNPADLIVEINNMRVSYGIPVLTTHPALMKVAQQEANGIAAGNDGHWRPYGLTLGQWLILEGYPLSGDLRLDGYRSENWGMGTSAQDVIEQIHDWVSSEDEPHTNTMLSTERSDIGAGVASSKNEWGIDQIFFVIETAMRTGTGQQQSEARDFLTSLPTLMSGAKSIDGTPLALSEGQYIVPVIVSTARPDGDVFHEVRSGQTLWSIAIYYHTTIEQIRRLNNLGADNTVYQGQKLLVKKGATQPVSSPTRTPTVARSPIPKTSAPPTATPGPEKQSAAVPGNGNAPALGVIFFAFLVLAGVIASSLKMKS